VTADEWQIKDGFFLRTYDDIGLLFKASKLLIAFFFVKDDSRGQVCSGYRNRAIMLYRGCFSLAIRGNQSVETSYCFSTATKPLTES